MSRQIRVFRKRSDAAEHDGTVQRAQLDGALSTGGARPLDPALRSGLEPRFGYDFRQVRVHTDGEAARSAESLSARAYTVGSDIVFGAGQYNPQSGAGQELIAHELAHVVQQSSGQIPASGGSGLAVSRPGDSLEHSADQMAGAALTGAAPLPAAAPAQAAVQRAAEEEAEELPPVAEEIPEEEEA